MSWIFCDRNNKRIIIYGKKILYEAADVSVERKKKKVHGKAEKRLLGWEIMPDGK